MKQVLIGMMSLVALLLSNPCEAYEVKKNSSGKSIRWVDETVVLKMSTAFAERFGEERALSAARGAAREWSDLPGVPTIVVELAPVPPFHASNPQNCIHLASEWVTTGDELALTYTLSTPEGYVAGSSIVVNGEHPFEVLEEEGGFEKFDLQAVLTHEMGHVLGLAENPHDEEATMHPDIGPGETFQRSLEEDDRAGAVAIYQEEVPEVAGCQFVAARGAQGRGQAPSLLFLVLGLAFWRSKWGTNQTEDVRTIRTHP